MMCQALIEKKPLDCMLLLIDLECLIINLYYYVTN